jgi:hypothetical protein
VTTGGNKTRLYDTTKEGLISKYCKVKEDYLKEITTPYKNKIPMHVYSFLIEYKISYGATI